MSQNSVAVRRLYKQILFRARRFPSIKRDTLVEDIRVEFRQNAHLEEGTKEYDKAIDIAIRSLGQLRQYVDGDDKNDDMSITLEQNPLGRVEDDNSHWSERASSSTPAFADENDAGDLSHDSIDHNAVKSL